ncbi:hypothetical protein HBI25_063750 [Parastagonospora nodorum]|uniref:Tox3 n=2 Tax=Phaeosphaeria nodorum TaxID=13684 RepID=A0A411PNQ6_PHAND|nr:hypothetical protein HBH53_041710 [Parastagonospora nodorum]KAH4000644.1 hypothetical protein HBI10_104610 [Parastagonospora nodorum]KAH4026339.1 hypothetical protein HBI13_061010 [Parastagonospora nodorum]KAH4223997.1 hypothetical protein HBI06_130490 [Parastagonospora nodorum]KAH4241209.1 hypothetical protein HBI05_093530 [Parastagonospora nodorum]
MHFTKFLLVVQAAATAIALALEPRGPGDIQLTREEHEAIFNGSPSDWTEDPNFKPDVPEQQRPATANDLSKRYIKANNINFGTRSVHDCRERTGIQRDVKVLAEIPFETDDGPNQVLRVTWSNALNVDRFDPLPIVTVPGNAASTTITAIHDFCLMNPTTSPPTRCLYQLRQPFTLGFDRTRMHNNIYLTPPNPQRPTMHEVCIRADECPAGRVFLECSTRTYGAIPRGE